MTREPLLRSQQPADAIVSKSIRGMKVAITERSVAKHAQETFGNSEKAAHWLNRPNRLFDGKTPLQVMQVDPKSVEAELVRIDYGVYA
jgi:uncharacterized protein (DUF2384 family)